MRLPDAAMIASLSLLAAGTAQAAPQQTTADGVYTEAQAERGARVYAGSCVLCHGANLAGTYETPPLEGRFLPNWSGATLDKLFDYVSTAMPLHSPGALSPAESADVVAYILQVNGMPAGSAELPARIDRLKTIQFRKTP